MLGWVTINLERDILGKLVRLSQHPVRRHAIKVLNIFMVQLLSSITSEDEPSSDPHHAGARLLLAQAIKGSLIAELLCSLATLLHSFRGSHDFYRLSCLNT